MTLWVLSDSLQHLGIQPPPLFVGPGGGDASCCSPDTLRAWFSRCNLNAPICPYVFPMDFDGFVMVLWVVVSLCLW